MEKISLAKRSESVKISLKKAGVTREKVCLRVACALDISGSMDYNFRSGKVTELVDRLLPVADQFDDNSEIDMWLFNTGSKEAPAATPANYGGYVGKAVPANVCNDGTNYAPVIKDIHHHYFGVEEKKGFFGFGGKSKPVTDSDIPALVFFVTDGANGDVNEAKRLMESIKNEPVYWMMVGLGNERFTFLKEMADKYDNVGFITFNSLDMSDDQLYSSIINGELAEWINDQKA